MTLSRIDFKNEGVHVGLYDLHRLVGSEVILDSLAHLFHSLLHIVDLSIGSFELRAEFWVDDVVVLLGFTDVNALFKHRLELAEFFQCGAQGFDYFCSQRVVFLNHVFIEVADQTL